jgi:hypothetical protein
MVATDLHPGKIRTRAQLEAIREALEGRLDSLSEMSSVQALRLQMAMDRRSKMLEPRDSRPGKRPRQRKDPEREVHAAYGARDGAARPGSEVDRLGRGALEARRRAAADAFGQVPAPAGEHEAVEVGRRERLAEQVRPPVPSCESIQSKIRRAAARVTLHARRTASPWMKRSVWYHIW